MFTNVYLLSKEVPGQLRSVISRLAEIASAIDEDGAGCIRDMILWRWPSLGNANQFPPGDRDLLISSREHPVSIEMIRKRAEAMPGFGYVLSVEGNGLNFAIDDVSFKILSVDIAVASLPLLPPPAVLRRFVIDKKVSAFVCLSIAADREKELKAIRQVLKKTIAVLDASGGLEIVWL